MVGVPQVGTESQKTRIPVRCAVWEKGEVALSLLAWGCFCAHAQTTVLDRCLMPSQRKPEKESLTEQV